MVFWYEWKAYGRFNLQKKEKEEKKNLSWLRNLDILYRYFVGFDNSYIVQVKKRGVATADRSSDFVGFSY